MELILLFAIVCGKLFNPTRIETNAKIMISNDLLEFDVFDMFAPNEKIIRFVFDIDNIEEKNGIINLVERSMMFDNIILSCIVVTENSKISCAYVNGLLDCAKD